MSWREVARVAFQSHVRSPWALVFAVLGLGPLVLFGVALLLAPSMPYLGLPPVLYEAALLPLASRVGTLVLLLLLARVVLSFRGAFLLDPEGARGRVGGFYAGTVGAFAAGYVPVVLLWSLLVGHLSDDLATSLKVGLGHAAAGLLFGAAWIAVLLLVCVAVEDLERRCAAAVLAWALLAVLVPALGGLLVALFPHVGDDGGLVRPAWGLVLDALSPWRAYELLSSSSGYAPFPQAYAYGGPGSFLFHPMTFTAVLLAWAAVPLALAARLQSRRGGGDPAPEVAP